MPDLVYIADDEPNIRKLAALALKDSGFETQEFADGVSLMAAVRVRKPDAIVLDWICLLYTSPSPRDMRRSRMPSSA